MIAVVCRGFGNDGSVPNVAFRQARELARRFEVLVVSDSFPAVLPDGVRAIPLVVPPFERLRRLGHVPRELAFAIAARSALVRIGEERPARAPRLVICHGHVPVAVVARPLSTRFGTRTIIVVHGDVFDRPPRTYDARLTALYRWATPIAYREAAGVVALSPFMVDACVRSGANRGDVRLIPNGISAEEIGLEEGEAPARRKPGERDGPLRVLFVGRLSVEKGVRTLLSACSLLKDRAMALDVTIAGSGPLESELRRQADTGGLDATVRFVGGVPRRSLGSLYSETDVVCVPSLSDPLPTVALEALVAGRALVAARVGGLPFIAREGDSSLLFPAGDGEALAAALERLLRDRALLGRLQAGALEAAKGFSWEACGARLSVFISDLLNAEAA